MKSYKIVVGGTPKKPSLAKYPIKKKKEGHNWPYFMLNIA